MFENLSSIGHLHNGILFGHRKEEHFTFATAQMDLENNYAKRKRQVRERQVPMISLICGI